MLNLYDVDEILHIQLTVARLGEKELMNWWNTDVVYKLGGADFLRRLLGPDIALLAAGEAVLEAARSREMREMHNMPASQKVFSLFIPEPQLYTVLKERWRHFKRYLEEVPPIIREILNSERDWTASELIDRIGKSDDIRFQGTSFGKILKPHRDGSLFDSMMSLAASIAQGEKGAYPFCYYEGALYDAS